MVPVPRGSFMAHGLGGQGGLLSPWVPPWAPDHMGMGMGSVIGPLGSRIGPLTSRALPSAVGAAAMVGAALAVLLVPAGCVRLQLVHDT